MLQIDDFEGPVRELRIIDKASRKLIPDELEERFPEGKFRLGDKFVVGKAKADGNCIQRSVSLALHKSEELHTEIRMGVADALSKRV